MRRFRKSEKFRADKIFLVELERCELQYRNIPVIRNDSMNTKWSYEDFGQSREIEKLNFQNILSLIGVSFTRPIPKNSLRFDKTLQLPVTMFVSYRQKLEHKNSFRQNYVIFLHVGRNK